MTPLLQPYLGMALFIAAKAGGYLRSRLGHSAMLGKVLVGVLPDHLVRQAVEQIVKRNIALS